MSFRILMGTIAATASICAQSATVDWRAGSGSNGQQFTISSGTTDQGALTLGLRAIERGVGPVTPVGNVYAANLGLATGSLTRAWWNFDVYAGLTGVGTLAGLSALTLGITTLGGSTPASASFNLLNGTLRAAIDCHVIGCVNGSPVNPDAMVIDLVAGNDGPGSATADMGHFYNASQNPTFAPWFAPFDVNNDGIYNFTLTAIDRSGQSVQTSMSVNAGNVVPEPGSLALFGLALAGLAASGALRRKI